MARIRTIKPDFWEDEKVGLLPIPCRLFFIGCWNFADDFGVIKGNAALLKSQIFPYDENLRASEIKKWIDALVNARMLIPIIHAEESYYVIRTFRSHQVLDNRYSKSYISKDKSLVSRIVDTAISEHNVNTSSTPCVHNVITTEEMEKEKEDKETSSCEDAKKAQLSLKEKKKKEVDLGFVLPGFVNPLRDWLEYKKSRKQSYAGEKQIRLCFQNLQKLSDNNPAIAQLIVDQSIANNWAGLFELKQNVKPKAQASVRPATRPGFNNYDEAESNHVGGINSIEL